MFVQAELPCEEGEQGRYSNHVLLETFLNAGSIALVNVVSMLVFVELLCAGFHYAVSLCSWVVFWTWHAIVLYWIGSAFSDSVIVNTGLFIAFHISGLALAFGVSWWAAYNSVPTSYAHYTSANPKYVWVKISIGAFCAAAIVIGVVLLSANADLRVLVSIIGDLPVLSIISVSWLFFNRAPASDLRKWVHFIQLLYKSTPLFLCLFPAALVWQETCDESGNWGWRILTSVVVFCIVAVYNFGVFAYVVSKQRVPTDARKYVRVGTASNPKLMF